jgi:hypothetical protein
MKKILTIIFILLSQNSFTKEFQLGFVLGSPTGISAKIKLDNKHSIDAVLAYSLVEDLGLEFHGDYLIEKAKVFSSNAGVPFELFYGIGARAAIVKKGKHSDEVAIGPRIPLGIIYKMSEPRIEFFGELALVFDIIPETNSDLQGGVGMRYCF